MLIPPRILKGAARLASRDSARYQLAGVFLERDENGKPLATSTNGKFLFHGTWREDDDAEYPEAPRPLDTGRLESGPIGILPVGAALELAKAAPSRPLKPILGNIHVEEAKAAGCEPFRCVSTDLERWSESTVRMVEATYPEYNLAIGGILETDGAVRVCLNPWILMEAVKAVTESQAWRNGSHQEGSVELVLQPPPEKSETSDGYVDRPVAIVAKAGSEEQTAAYVMPFAKG